MDRKTVFYEYREWEVARIPEFNRNRFLLDLVLDGWELVGLTQKRRNHGGSRTLAICRRRHPPSSVSQRGTRHRSSER